MQRIVLKSKIHNATITQVNLKYEGSLTIDEQLLEKADIAENERVQVVNCNNGTRLETYVITGEKGSGIIGLNGPAARLGNVGDIIHIITYAIVSEKELESFRPKVIILDKNNKIAVKK
ncbi:MAG: aspartate 1-decarboxylase [Candidatus Latescibacteria bacterium]|nr:aspartate 1-decarboxylase [Candidatus Latescibacterota bacterium]